jgi:alkanesulfonate monooxygenase SsuD/methylene tetrahydromethanopterin reductase-like flavin-dependent oxidoreductase (luciferase family)
MKLRIMTEPQQGADYASLRTVAQAAEDLGFDAFFRSDHYLKMGDGSGLPGPTSSASAPAGSPKSTPPTGYRFRRLATGSTASRSSSPSSPACGRPTWASRSPLLAATIS